MTVKDMVANSAAWEKFQSHFRGWRDGASGRAKNPQCAEHKLDCIRVPYNEGYDAGHKASNAAAGEAAKKYGYDIQSGILR